jgi:uncharacterized protein
MSFTVDKDVLVPMRDGAELNTDVWHPAGVTRGPVLVVRLPYAKDTMMYLYGTYTHPNIFALVEAGYTIAIQDCRGTGRSPAPYRGYIGDDVDGADMITWLIDQPWCDGNVGMYGASALGFTQWQAAATGVTGLKAIVPANTSSDLYQRMYSPGGALSVDTVMRSGMAQALIQLSRVTNPSVEQQGEMGALFGAMADATPFVAASPTADRPLLAKYTPWIVDWLDNPTRESYWGQDAYASIDKFEQITAPALNIGGWYDLFIGDTLRAYTEMKRRGGSAEARDGQRLIVGPWSHTAYSGLFPDRAFGIGASTDAAMMAQVHIAFYDRWLRGREDALDGYAPVRIFVMGLDQWRDEQDWPLPDTEYVDFHLDGTGKANAASGDGVLQTELPQTRADDTYLYNPSRPVPSIGPVGIDVTSFDGPADQRAVEVRDDVLVYSTPVLSEALEVTGHVSLTLFVSSSAVDTDFTGKLVDVYPDGRVIILCEGIQRMRYRNSLAAAELMTPGEIYEITIDLVATSNVFLPGHQVRLEVSSSNFPRYDRNTNTGGVIASEHERDSIVAVNNIHHGPENPSRLTLPTINR